MVWGSRSGLFLGRGFTLIELLVVIAILGVLGTIVFVAIGGQPQERARQNRAQFELNKLGQIIDLARALTGRRLADITGSWWSEGSCRSSSSVSQGCIDTMTEAWRKIFEAAEITIDENFRDPWGGVYVIDENEGEYSNNPCRQDTVKTYGPNNSSSRGGDEDNIVISLAVVSDECR